MLQFTDKSTMKTHLILALCASLLIACGSGFTTPPITIPQIDIPPITFKQSIRQPIGVTSHADGSFTLDTISRVPHKARTRIATLRSEADAKFIAMLWNASISVTP